MKLQPNQGLVVQRTKGFYQVETANGEEITCKLKSSLFQTTDSQPIVLGDLVEFEPPTQGEVGRIVAAQERSSVFQRRRAYQTAPQIFAANLDVVLIVTSITAPPIRSSLIARFLILAHWGLVEPVLIFTKADLAKVDELKTYQQRFERQGIQNFATSLKGDFDKTALKEFLRGKLGLLVGHSGVGKSSLLNHLFGLDLAKEGAVNMKTKRGIHTTTLAHLFRPEVGFRLIDTPGIRNCQLFFEDLALIPAHYTPFQGFLGQCAMKNCCHLHEPNCRVKAAVEAGELDGWFYQAYEKCFRQEMADAIPKY